MHSSRSEAWALPESLSEVQTLRPHPRPNESESVFQQDLQVIQMHIKI